MKASGIVLMSKLKRFFNTPFHGKLNALRHQWRKMLSFFYYRRVFGKFGRGSVLYKPVLVSNPQYIFVGENVLIREGARLELVVIDPANPPELHIEDNVNIEQFVHIAVMGKVHIRRDSTITAHCSLLCGNHPFLDVHSSEKINSRIGGLNSFIEIGPGAMLGVGTVVQMNVRIGKHVVIGSNSVVKKSLPDYSVADGNPASIGMRYDWEQNRWITVGDKKRT